MPTWCRWSRLQKVLLASVLLLGALSAVVFLRPPDDEDLDEMVVEDIETAAEHSPHASAWKTVGQKSREQFVADYRAAEDKRQVFEQYEPVLGAAALLDFLDLTYPLCHEQAHDLGRAIYTHSQDLGASLRACATRCTSGCMHGVLAQALAHADRRDGPADLQQACNAPELAQTHKPGNCAHGVGHALMHASANNLDRALLGCRRFSDPGMEYYCATGVYMEYRAHVRAAREAGEPIAQQTLHFPCDRETRFPAACYRYMLRSIRHTLGADRQRLKRECQTLPDRQRIGCFHGLGAIYVRSVAKRPALLPELCETERSEDRAVCIEGAIEKLADFDEARAREACAELTGPLEAACRAAADEKMYRLNKPTLRLYIGTEHT
ncbi:MAG: hypothetical protein KGN30_13930 [Nitrospirota bacterium]|nr:hypothetical protein [Nitrospirota bacterium]